MENEVAVSESNFGGSFLPSSVGDDIQQHDGLDQEHNPSVLGSMDQLDPAQSSALEVRQQEAAAILDLERDMTDLKEIHQELNTHIHDQGEGIDRIELQTEKAGNRVAKAQDDTRTAVEINRDSKSVLWIIIGISVGVIAVVLLIIIILVIVLTTV